MHAPLPLSSRGARAGLAALVALAAGAVGAGTARGGPPTEAKPAPVTLCLAVAPDDSPVVPVAEVRADFRGFAVACSPAAGEGIEHLKATWIALDVGNVAPANTVIASTSVPVGKRGHAGFTFSLPRDLPVGSYRVDLEADGKAWASLPVPVVAATEVALPERPDDLIPLAKGTTWVYDFRLEGGAGVTLTLPGIQPDAAGVLHAKGTYTVVSRDATTASVEVRRNEDVVLTETWVLDAKGLAVTGRRAGAESLSLDPPQPLLPWPAKGLTAATWVPKGGDAAAAQGIRTWGPATVPGPSGPTSGWVVLTSVPAAEPQLTIERQFVPGLGMVRETIVRAVGGRLVSRQTSVLLPSK